MELLILASLLTLGGIVVGGTYDDFDLPPGEDDTQATPETMVADLFDSMTNTPTGQGADATTAPATTADTSATHADCPTTGTTDATDTTDTDTATSDDTPVVTTDLTGAGDGYNTITMTPTQTSAEGTSDRDHVIGNDLGTPIDTGAGNDRVEAAAGDDTVNTGAGNDRVFAGDGADSVIGGTGNDRIFLNDGDDRYGTDFDSPDEAGNDFVRGGAGNDILVDSQGSNTLRGDTGRDILIGLDQAGEDTADTLHGGYGADRLFGDNGDVLTGGEGTDDFYITRLEDTAGNPVTLTDYDVVSESLTIVVADDTAAGQDVLFSHDPATLALRVSLAGTDVAILQDISVSEATSLTVTVMAMDDLLAQAA